MCKLTVVNFVFLNVRKQILLLIYIESRYLELVYELLETFQMFLYQTICKEYNIINKVLTC